MADHVSSDRPATTEVVDRPDAPRSRRDVLVVGLGGLAAAVAARMAQPVPAAAASARPLLIGVTNTGGTKRTTLTSGASTTLKVSGSSGASGASVIRAVASATSGEVTGVRASTVSGHIMSNGVLGTATVGTGVQGVATGLFGYGVWGVSSGSKGTGVRGVSKSNGVEGHTSGATDESAGVMGTTTATANIVHGVSGQTNSSNEYSAGVMATSAKGGGQALRAEGTGGAWGVWARATGGIGTFALMADGHVYIVGNCVVTGNVAKAAGSFRIDHPLEPEHKYLQHSFVESPDMKNVYDGVVTLGARGSATVRLPRWFEALNRDFRYQLTPIGSPAPGLYVKQGVEANRFVIAGGEAGQRVSWQVTGIRHDAYARKHPIKVEVRKRGDDVGRLLHPTEAGRPARLRLGPDQAKRRLARRARRLPKGVQKPVGLPADDA